MRHKPYGAIKRSNQAGDNALQRDPDVELSIFDNDAFQFYLMKYAEVIGVDVLVIAASNDRQMSYD